MHRVGRAEAAEPAAAADTAAACAGQASPALLPAARKQVAPTGGARGGGAPRRPQPEPLGPTRYSQLGPPKPSRPSAGPAQAGEPALDDCPAAGPRAWACPARGQLQTTDPLAAHAAGEAIEPIGGWSAMFKQLQEKRQQVLRAAAGSPGGGQDAAHPAGPPAAAGAASPASGRQPAAQRTPKALGIGPGVVKPRGGARRTALGPMLHALRARNEFDEQE